MKRTTFLTLAASSLVACLVAASARSSQTPTGPHAPLVPRRLPLPGEFNVLVIVLDDLGSDQLKMYAVDGGPPTNCPAAQTSGTQTPRMDALRAQGELFTRCYVDPICSATRASFLTGRHGIRTGMGTAVNPGDQSPFVVSTNEVFLPELIRDANTAAYRRAAFGKWHMAGYTGDDCHPGDCGFEVFQGMMGNPEGTFNNPASHYGWRKVTDTGGGVSGCTSSSSSDVPPVTGLTPSESFWDAGVTRTDAENWINSLSPSEPFFAYVAFSPPHEPNEVPPFRTISVGTQARLGASSYEAGDTAHPGQFQHADEKLIFHAMIEGLDWEIGRLLDDISPAVLAKTMIIVIDDNGTEGTVMASSALSGHGKRSVYDLGTRVPMFVVGPLVGTHAGQACRELVSGVDIWRTVANITGIGNPTIDAVMTGITLDSVSFLNLIENPSSASQRSTAYSEIFLNGDPPPTYFNYKRGITDSHYRYMRLCAQNGTITELFFHTEIDPCEQNPLDVNNLGADQPFFDNLSNAMDSL